MTDYPLDNFEEVYTGTERTRFPMNDNSVTFDMNYSYSAHYTYDTGIKIDLQNGSGVEYWFDFTTKGTSSMLVDVSQVNSNVIKDTSIAKYCMQMSINRDPENFIAKNTEVQAYNGYTWSNHYNLNTQYVILKVIGHRRVFHWLHQYQIYDKPERTEADLVATIDLSHTHTHTHTHQQ